MESARNSHEAPVPREQVLEASRDHFGAWRGSESCSGRDRDDEFAVELVDERAIYLIRGEKVMLDADLAELSGVATKALVQAVKRNLSRFLRTSCSSSRKKSSRAGGHNL